MRAFISMLSLVAFAHAQDIPQRHVGKPHCTVNSKEGTLSMRFVTRLNGDDINHVYGIRTDLATNDFNLTTCDYTIETVPAGTGAGTYYIVESVMPLSGATDANSINPCGFRQSTTNTGNNKFEWMIALRFEGPWFIHDIDRNYAFACLEETATNTYLWINLDVKHDNLTETLTPRTPNVIMRALTLNTATQNFEFATSCTVGEDVKLELVYDIVDYVDYLTFWGLYSYNTKVAESSSTSATEYNLVDGSGCNYASNILGLEGGFTRLTGSDTEMFKARTSVFKCRRFWTSYDLYFTTHVKFCAGSLNQDQKCINYCSYNNALGRRKRQAEESDNFEVSVRLIIREEDDTQGSKGMNSTLLIAVTVGVGVVLVLALLAVLFVCLRMRRNNDLDSRASSEKSLPVKF